jgi:hypothetical protein
LRNKKNIAQSKKDSQNNNSKGKKYRDNLVQNDFSTEAQEFEPEDDQNMSLTEKELSLLQKDDIDSNTSVSSDVSLSDLGDAFSQKKLLREKAKESTKNLQNAQIQEIKTYRKNQDEKQETNNMFKLLLLQQMAKFQDNSQNGTLNQIKNIKGESKQTYSKHMVEVFSNDTVDLVLKKFNLETGTVHTKIETLDKYRINSVSQLKEGEEYKFE